MSGKTIEAAVVVCRLGTGIFFLVEALFLSSCGLGLSASLVARVPCWWAGPAMKCGMRHLAVEEPLFSSKGGINSAPASRSVGFSLIGVINSPKTWLHLVELLSPHVEPWENGDILPSKLLPQWDLRFRPQASLRIAPDPQISVERDLRQRRGQDHNYSEKNIFPITGHSVRVLKWVMRVWLLSAWLGILATSIPLYRPEWSLVIQWMEKGVDVQRLGDMTCAPSEGAFFHPSSMQRWSLRKKPVGLSQWSLGIRDRTGRRYHPSLLEPMMIRTWRLETTLRW